MNIAQSVRTLFSGNRTEGVIYSGKSFARGAVALGKALKEAGHTEEAIKQRNNFRCAHIYHPTKEEGTETEAVAIEAVVEQAEDLPVFAGIRAAFTFKKPTPAEEEIAVDLFSAINDENAVDSVVAKYEDRIPAEKKAEFADLISQELTSIKEAYSAITSAPVEITSEPSVKLGEETVTPEQYFSKMVEAFGEAMALVDDRLRLNVLEAVKQQYDSLTPENRGSFHAMDSKALASHVNSIIQWRQSVVQTTYQLIAAEGAAPEVVSYVSQQANDAMFQLNPEKYLREQATAKAIELAAAAQPEVANPAMQEALQAAAGQKTSGINRRNRRTAGDGQGA